MNMKTTGTVLENNQHFFQNLLPTFRGEIPAGQGQVASSLLYYELFGVSTLKETSQRENYFHAWVNII